MKAIDNVDLSQGVKFSTYAVPMIIGEIRRYLRDNNSIRVSRSLRDIAYRAIYAKESYIKSKKSRLIFGDFCSFYFLFPPSPSLLHPIFILYRRAAL